MTFNYLKFIGHFMANLIFINYSNYRKIQENLNKNKMISKKQALELCYVDIEINQTIIIKYMA